MGPFAVVAIQHAARRLDDLPIPGAPEFDRTAAAFRMGLELIDMSEYALHKRGRGCGIVQGDVVRDCIQIRERWLRPDYFSHRAMRVRASACDTTLPSATAISPRAMPSRSAMRFCCSS